MAAAQTAKGQSPIAPAPSPYKDVLTDSGATATDMANLTEEQFLAKYGVTKNGYRATVTTNKSL